MLHSVMLVDNESVITKGLSQMIDWEKHGCSVDAIATDGLDAIHQIQQCVPDILITDIKMPEMDGLELCSWIRKEGLDIQIIISTGFPEFDYAQQAIQYGVIDFILKPTTEENLVRAVDKAVVRIAENEINEEVGQSLALEQEMLLSELAFGARHSLLYMINKLNRLGIKLLEYRVICLNVSGIQEPNQLIEEAEFAKEFFQSYFEGEQYWIPVSDNEFYIVVCGASKDIFEACQKSVDYADLEANYELTIGISRLQNDPLNMKNACRQAADAQKFAQYSTQPSIVYSEDLPEISKEKMDVILEKMQLIESALENNHADAVDKAFADFFSEIRMAKIPFSAVNQLAKMLSNFCMRILLSYETLSFNEDYMKEILYSENLDSLEKELQEKIRYTMSQIRLTSSNIDEIVYNVKKYVDQHYVEPLSLDSLADYAHLSPSYLSKLFKKEIGENLSSYITHVRIEQAKILLRTTDRKTYEIAENVGIYDPVYFSKIFKKATGDKPKDYRLKYLEGNN